MYKWQDYSRYTQRIPLCVADAARVIRLLWLICYGISTVDYLTPCFIFPYGEVHLLENRILHEISRISSFSDLMKGIAE